jgi:hypothetical protein
MNNLSTIEKLFFRKNGYLRLKGSLPEGLIEQALLKIEIEFSSKRKPYRINKSGTISRIDQLLSRGAVFLEVLRDPLIKDALISLLGEDIEVAKFRHNHATLNRKGDIPERLHRDIQQWSRPLVAVFVYLENSNIDNGCTHIVPGSQFLPYAGPQSLDGGGNWADEHEDYEFILGQSLPVPMNKGEVLLLDCLTFHTVGKNSSDETRKSMVFACHSVDDVSGRDDDQKSILLCGHRKYKGTDVLQESGSLQNA